MIPLAVPNLTGREREYLDNCIDTTYVSSVGEYVTRLEEMTGNACGAEYAVATSAGTTGLHAALMAVGVKAGELVIVPAFTFIASANAIAHCGAKPWLMDISPEDWCLSISAVRTALDKECEVKNGEVIHKTTGCRVAAVMPVYTLGNIPDMEEFRELADQYGLPLVADAACAIGASYHSRPFGALADVSVVSFNGNKTVTCGGGGMVVGNDRELLEHIRHITTTARTGTEYNFDAVGYNYRMTNLQAAVGCAQMERLEEFISVKRRIRNYYASQLEECKDNTGISFFPSTEGSSCWFSGIVLPQGYFLDDVRQIGNRLKDLGIESRTFWKPVHMQEPYKNVPRESVKTAESIWERIITLPCSTNIKKDELEYVARSVEKVLDI